VRSRWSSGWGVEAGVRVHLQEVVGLVFEDDEVVFLRDGIDFFTALGRLCRAGWVLACGHSVQDERLRAAASGLVPFGEDFVESVCAETACVNAYTGDLDALGSCCFDGGGECEFFAEDPVAAFAEHSHAHIDCARRSDGHGAAPVLVRWRVDDFRVLDDPSQELGRAVTLTVVESSGKIVVGLSFGEIMLAGR
jgi:hypothetical protein